MTAATPHADPRTEVTRSRLLAEQRDDGVLAGRLPHDAVPGPEVVWLLAAVATALVPPVLGAPGASWVWVGAGTVLAVVGSCGRGWPRLRWTTPALLRALEYGAVLVLAGGTAWSYILLATLAFHHYDIVYRLRLRGTGPPRWLGTAAGGWAVRIGVLVAAAALGAVEVAVTAASLVLAPITVTESITSWVTPRRSHADR